MLTVRSRVLKFVDELAKTTGAFDELEKRVLQFSREQLVEVTSGASHKSACHLRQSRSLDGDGKTSRHNRPLHFSLI